MSQRGKDHRRPTSNFSRRALIFVMILITFVAYELPMLYISFGRTSKTDPVLVSVVMTSISKGNWWDKYVDEISRPYRPWNGTDWCKIDVKQSARLQEQAHQLYKIDRKVPRIEGFMLGKVHKAASTTSASVTLRIARRVAERRIVHSNVSSHTIHTPPYVTPMCQAHFYHDFTTQNFHSHRNVDKSFLWSTVRLPHARSESAFYYYVPNHNYDNPKRHLEFLHLSRGHQIRLLRRRNRPLNEYGGQLWRDKPTYGNTTVHKMGVPNNAIIQNNPDKLAYQHVRQEILDFYDFIAITERWLESMAVLKLLLPEIRYSDLVALRVKESGAYANVYSPRGGKCKYIPKPPSTLPAAIQDYINGPFRETNPDYLLYAAVNRSLDLSIEHLGKQRVDEGVRRIRYLQSLIEDQCQHEVIGACTKNGEWVDPSNRNCLVRDFGCGHSCMDHVLSDNM